MNWLRNSGSNFYRGWQISFPIAHALHTWGWQNMHIIVLGSRCASYLIWMCLSITSCKCVPQAVQTLLQGRIKGWRLGSTCHMLALVQKDENLLPRLWTFKYFNINNTIKLHILYTLLFYLIVRYRSFLSHYECKISAVLFCIRCLFRPEKFVF